MKKETKQTKPKRKRNHKLEYAIKMVKKRLGISCKLYGMEIVVPRDFDKETAHPQLKKYLDYLIERGYNIQYSIFNNSE